VVKPSSISRRSFLAAATGAAAWVHAIEAAARSMQPLRDGRLIGTVPLGRLDRRPAPPFHVLLDSGLDARQFTDLSSLDDSTLITPNDRFFIRTSAPSRTSAEKWTMAFVAGDVAGELPLSTLTPSVRPMGTHLIECAGNSDPANFGLMSVAQWDGVPVITAIEPLARRARRVQITGIDDTATRSRSSQPGASWIFSREDLERTGAFFATRMNGAPLPENHGGPIRLVVPGWYGCTCIKWVSRIDFVVDEAPATTQMIEFARRTHQDGLPKLAGDYEAPAIELAAMPIRVEQWSTANGTVYRVIGIVWGGEKPTNALTIRFKHNEPFVPVSDCPMPSSTTTWSLWSHEWRPREPGRYRIVLRPADASVKARRLDMFFYARDVDIAAT
jgi:DMSO/TMAO reductase YedYZ molybdopterin-dependent catalytic subunit